MSDLNTLLDTLGEDSWWCNKCGQLGKVSTLYGIHGKQHDGCDYLAIIVPTDPATRAFIAVARAAEHRRAWCQKTNMTTCESCLATELRDEGCALTTALDELKEALDERP